MRQVLSHSRSQGPRDDPLDERYRAVRGLSEKLCEPLAPEDCVIQSMPDVSPTRWHLAHTTWFFETFVLAKAIVGHKPLNPAFEYLFNSYYNAVGEPFPRSRRGLLSRPTVEEIFQYRKAIDERMNVFFVQADGQEHAEWLPVVEIGLQHEQQHQELMLTDIKHVLACNPLYPAYRDRASGETEKAPPLAWVDYDEAVRWMGHEGKGFSFDNETPRHRVFVGSFELASRPTTHGEYLDFINDGGYERPELWLSAGWQQAQSECWRAPLYWIRRDDDWWQYALSGLRPVNREEPVCHVSYFEADAFARWAGARLPTEAEWEVAAAEVPIEGNFVEQGVLHPAAPVGATNDGTPLQMYGDVWEWTSSAYSPYPGYRPLEGALGEYNGKFMCNQYVLRGGSCATSRSHMRPTYRNFFPPDARWQFSGIRLAK